MKLHITVEQLQELDWENIVNIGDALEMSYINVEDIYEEIVKKLTITKMIELLTLDSYYCCLSYINDEWVAERDNDLSTLSARSDEACDALWELIKLDLDEWRNNNEQD
jgi:hypothetical protein